MKRNLEISSKLFLTNGNATTEFYIDDIVGIGGSCIAYKVSYCESEDITHKGILKEFCPAYLNEHDAFKRDEQAIIVPEIHIERFATDLERFKQVYKDINNYLSENLSAANYHTVQLGIYEGNNTLYTLTSCDYGKSYDRVLDDNLYTVLKLVLSLTKAVELYHNAGFLHLDIKPKNVLILDDIADVVKLFDFDSLTPIDAFKSRGNVIVPAPEDYYVPELEACDYRNIGIHTDIFEIGALLFSRLFGRAPEINEMQHNSKIELDNLPLLTGVSPQARYELGELFAHTIKISKRNRYRTTEELRHQLTKLIELLSPHSHAYLMDLPRWQPSALSIDRKASTKTINNILDEHGFVFVKAIGGLGKSELAKLYVKEYAHKYHTVQFCKYSDSLRTVIASMPVDGINDDEYSNFDDLVKEKNKVLHMSDSQTLIIVDNFNVTHDEFMRDFLPCNEKSFKVIFTTRCMPAANYYEDKVYELNKLSMEECKKLFYMHLQTDNELDDDLLEEIVEFIDYNTLVLVLLAATIKKSGISLKDMLDTIKEQKLDDIQTKVFHDYDISAEEVAAYNKINAHLNAIFNVSMLSEYEKNILKNMTLIPSEGIGVFDFENYCDDKSINNKAILGLIALGWIQKLNDNDIVMHPIISDLIANNANIPKSDSYYSLAAQLEEYCNPDYINHISVVMSRLSYALQLNRRYCSETSDKQTYMKAKVGRLYANIYRPDDARKYLLESLSMEENNNSHFFTPYLYSFLGEVEKDFGTTSKAIEYYQKSIDEGKRFKNRYHLIVIESMMNIAECLSDNNEKTKAFEQYVSALRYVRIHFVKSHIYEIASGLVSVCKDLDWLDKADKYEKLKNKYAAWSEDVEIPELKEVESSAAAGDFDASIHFMEEFLKQKRSELGEDSPLYKDMAQSRWIFYALQNDVFQAKRLATDNLSFVESTHGSVSMEMARQLSLIATMFPRLGEYDYAIESANKAIEICISKGEEHSYVYFEAKLALAQSYLMHGRLSEAKASISDLDINAFTGNEALSDFVSTAGFIFCELSEYDKVEVLCTKLLGKKNIQSFNKAQALILRAIVHEQKGMLEEAENFVLDALQYVEVLKDSVIKNEWLVQYYRIKARLFYRKGDYQTALNEINELFDLMPEEKYHTFIMYQPTLERGLYYDNVGDKKNASADFSTCELILKKENFPDEGFVLLYNNIANSYISSREFSRASEYLDRIVKIKPDVINPKSYVDAVVCNNIGWVAYHTNDLEKAEKFLHIAAETFVKIGSSNTADYFSLQHNIALLYEKKEDYKRSAEICQKLLEQYNPDVDVLGADLNEFDECYVRNLLAAGEAQDAYNYASAQQEQYALRFGPYSEQRIKILTAFGGYLKMHGYRESMEFFSMADEAIEKAGMRDTIYNARLLNYIGVCLTDFDGEHGLALNHFKQSKDLFDKLNAESDPLYQYVISNIKYAEEKNMDDLIQKLAESIIDENSNK